MIEADADSAYEQAVGILLNSGLDDLLQPLIEAGVNELHDNRSAVGPGGL